MTVNNYVRNFEFVGEQRLLEDLFIEFIQMYGTEIYYIPRVAVKEDPIFGEDVLQKYNGGYSLEAYISSTDGFEGEGDFLGKFGLELRDTVNFSISVRRFDETVHENVRPFEGDLIYFPISGGLFEIKFVEHENPFYQIGKLHTYALSCELFRYSGEELDTGIAEIDAVEKESGSTQNLTMLVDEIYQEDGLSDIYAIGDNVTLETIMLGNIIQESVSLGTYLEDEVVYQGASLSTATAVGRVAFWDHDDRILKIFVTDGVFKTSTQNHLLVDVTITDEDRLLQEDTSGTFVFELGEAEAAVTGVTSGAIYYLGTVADDSSAVEFSDNESYESQADDILDFSEGNPFGEFGNLAELDI
jgi:hypothetical protein